jgi:hypothetical protein
MLHTGDLARCCRRCSLCLCVHRAPRDNMLVIATNGRGMWVIDDVSAVQNFK